MVIVNLILGDLQTNCYLVYDSPTKETLIIDPADEADFISQKILDLNLKPKAILATHGHFDHLLAVAELKLNFKIPLHLNEADEKIVKDIYRSASYWLKRKIIGLPIKIDKNIREGDKIKIGGSFLKVLETPGHTPGSVCFYNQKEKILFSGDTLFADGFVGRTDFGYSDPKAMQKSVNRLLKLPSGVLVYPGHGEGFMI